MKKILVLLLITTVLFTGCEKVKDGYKEGTFEASVVDNYGGTDNNATAKISIDSEGKIKSVYLDTTYTTAEGVATTKKALKENYGMSAIGATEWYIQVEALEKAIVEHNGIDFLKLDENGKTDAVSSCTIKIDALYKAAEAALNKAK